MCVSICIPEADASTDAENIMGFHGGFACRDMHQMGNRSSNRFAGAQERSEDEGSKRSGKTIGSRNRGMEQHNLTDKPAVSSV